MEIEMIDENKIKCTLTRQELEERQIQLRDFAYGTEKVKNLFMDMLSQANKEFGFEAEGYPLIIDATPIDKDHIITTITKTEDQDDLKRRLDEIRNDTYPDPDTSREITKSKAPTLHDPDTETENDIVTETIEFPSMRSLMDAAKAIPTKSLHIASDVYKDPQNDHYMLCLYCTQEYKTEINKCCNTLLEFGEEKETTQAALSYMEEHYKTVIAKNALQILSNA